MAPVTHVTGLSHNKPIKDSMEDYIVSARKYRPASFAAVVGQPTLTTTLKNAVRSGKLAHAYLFCGPRGVGKTTCARIFAKVINCMSLTPDGEACGQCESCKAFEEQRSYNVFELDAASNNSVEHIKSLMEQTRIPPQVGKYKVFIIDEVHMLSLAAFNAFLKTLEEPPAHVIFILATTEKHKILPTILSRCQVYDFERMTVDGIVGHLRDVAQREGIACEEEALALIAEKADGGMRDALSLFDQAAGYCDGNITYAKVAEDLNVLDTDTYFSIVDMALANKVADLMLLVDSVIARGFSGDNIIGGLAAHVRNVMMAKDEQTVRLLETGQRQRERYVEQARRCNAAFLYNTLSLLNKCDLSYRQSSNKRLLVELTLIQVAQLTQPDTASADGAGRKPKRLKILFRLINNVRDNVAPQVAAPDSASDAATVAVGVGGAAVSAESTASRAARTEASVRTEVAHVTPDAAPTGGVTARPMLKLGSLGVTFDKLMNGERKESRVEEEVTNKEENSDFTVDDLLFQWHSMCNRMPTQMRALAARMKNMSPKIADFPAIEVSVDNQMLLDQVNGIRGRIRSTLARGLHNGQLTVTFRLAEVEEMGRRLTKKEVFDRVMQKSEAREFIKQLGLEIV